MPDPLKDQPIYSNMVFVRVHTDEGIVGELPCNGSFVDCEFVNRELAPLLVGKNPLETERIWDEIFRSLRQRFQAKGVSIVDCALWDIKGKYFGQPVWRLIGGARQKIPVYITLGSGKPIAEYSPEQFADWAEKLVSEGWVAVKFAIARGWRWYRSRAQTVRTEEEIITKVRSIREAVGNKVKIMVDSNTECSFVEAVRLSKLIEPFNISWYEEPVWGNDPRLLAQMKFHTSIPIAAGQYVASKWGFRDLIVLGNVDLVQPDIRYVGGITEALKVAHMAQAFNLPFETHSAPILNIQLVAGLVNGWGAEFHYTSWNSQKVLLKNTPEPKNGWVTVPDRPGLGLVPNEDALSEYLIE